MKWNKAVKGALLLTLLLTYACTKHETSTNITPIKVQTMQVITKDIPVEINSFGTLSPYKNVDIKAQVSGQINKIYFKEGSFIKKGELLISIDDSPYKANLKIDEAALSQDIEDYNYQKYVLEKDKKLSENGSLPKQEYLKMLTVFVQAEAKIKSDQAKIDLDKINLSYCSIISPIDGVIGYIKVDEGNIITSSSDILANVKQIDPLYVDFNVPGKDLFRIRSTLTTKGEIKLVVSVNSQKNDNSDYDIQYDGSLSFLNNEVQDTSSTIQLRGTIPNPKMELLPGLFVDVKLTVGEIKNAILVPEEGLLLDNDKHYFFVVNKEGKAEKVLVDVIGTHEGYFIAVENGTVKPGDRVIVSGLLNLIPGDAVSIDSMTNPDSSINPVTAK
ncbi:MAG: efflux RND transporter periplasmic adaptor subunit [Lentisphaerota bacterium]